MEVPQLWKLQHLMQTINDRVETRSKAARFRRTDVLRCINFALLAYTCFFSCASTFKPLRLPLCRVATDQIINACAT